MKTYAHTFTLFHIPKLLLITINATTITMGLLILMYLLIKPDDIEIASTPISVDDDFRMPDRVIDEYDEIELPDPPTELTLQPESPADAEIPETNDWTSGTLFTIADNAEGINIQNSFVLPQPVYRTQPQYPRAALKRGIEGFVELIFDVDEAGIPLNIKVYYAEPESTFDNAAIKAVKKWRYDPLNSSGNAEYKRNVMARLSFQISEGRK